jgi:fatty acid desaturase
MTYLLSIAADALKNYSYDWLFAASLPSVIYLLIKNRKYGWLKRFFIKWVVKRTRKRANKKRKMSKGTGGILFILGILGLGALLVWLLGWVWALIIILLIIVLVAVQRNEKDGKLSN